MTLHGTSSSRLWRNSIKQCDELHALSRLDELDGHLVGDDASSAHAGEKVWTMGLLLANFSEIECSHILDTCVGEWYARQTAGLDANYGEIGGQASRQIQIEQRLSYSVVYNKQVTWTSWSQLYNKPAGVVGSFLLCTATASHRGRLDDRAERQSGSETSGDFREQPGRH